MKKSLLVVTFSFITVLLSAQKSGYFDYIYFDSPDSTLKIDTTIAGNIWQIGKPHKTIFDSAYSPPNVMITDSVNYYPPNNFSVFTIKIFDPSWAIVPNDAMTILFEHKFDTDSLKDGGYIEISYDNGITWKNIINDTIGLWIHDLYNPYFSTNPIIANGNAAFTGHSNGWQSASLWGCDLNIFLNPIPVYLRFVFSSDSIQTNKEGWMIDNLFICIGCSNCLGVKELKNNESISVAPNPVIDKLTIIAQKNAEIEILNIAGQTIQTIYKEGEQTTVDLSNLTSGVYLIKATTDKEIAIRKIIKL